MNKERYHLKRRTFTCNERIYDKVDAFLEKIEKDTGVSWSKSTLIEYLFDLTLESATHLNRELIYSDTSMRKALLEAIAKQRDVFL